MAQLSLTPIGNTFPTTPTGTPQATGATGNSTVVNVAAALGNALAGTNVTDPDDALIKSLVVPATVSFTGMDDDAQEVPGAFTIDFTKLQELDPDRQVELTGRLQAEVTRRNAAWDTASPSNSSATTANTTTVNNATNTNAAPNPVPPNAPAGAHTALGQMLGPYKGAFGVVTGLLAGCALMGVATGAAASLATVKATDWVLEQKNVTYSHGEVQRDQNTNRYNVDMVDGFGSGRTDLRNALNEQWADPDRVAVFPTSVFLNPFGPITLP
ncbi:MAG: hypothetical protein V4787_05325, partial [Pseudomonadota bacterium]